jgi:predicted P-loop ATPase
VPVNLDIVQHYIDAEKRLFPVLSAKAKDASDQERGKKPLVMRWQNSPKSNPRTASGLVTSEAGWALDADDLIVDVDVRNNKKGLESLKKLNEACGIDLFQCAVVRVRTGSGGLHLYFKKDSNLSIHKKLKAYPDIEFLSSGCYAITAGSLHACGSFYEFLDETDLNETSMAPESLCKMLEKQNHKAEKTENTGKEKFVTDDASLGRAVFFLTETAEPAIEGSNGDETAYRVACRMHDFGLPLEQAIQLMIEHYNPRCAPPWSPNELIVKIKNAYNYAQNPVGALAVDTSSFGEVTAEAELPGLRRVDDEITAANWTDYLEWQMTMQGRKLRSSVTNARLLLRYGIDLRDAFVYNDFAQCVVLVKKPQWLKYYGDLPVDGLPLEDSLVIKLRGFLIDMYNVEFSLQGMGEAILDVALQNSSHPVRNFLNALEWDGVPRLDTWLHDYLTADKNAYTAAVGKKFMVGAVKRIMEPGCKFDFIMVLEGSQGLGKSTVGAALGDPWFTDQMGDLSSPNNQVEENIRGKWIVEVAELDSFGKADNNRIKHFLSRSVDRYRIKFDKYSKDHPRQCVFIGTTNQLNYLTDTTGNRRFWPIRCPRLKFEKVVELRNIREQLFAEAVQLYRSGKEKLYMDTKELEELAKSEQIERQIEDPWIEPITRYADGANVDRRVYDFLPTERIFGEILGIGAAQRYHRDQKRIAELMRSLGWYQDRKRIDGVLTRGWKRPVKDMEIEEFW